MGFSPARRRERPARRAGGEVHISAGTEGDEVRLSVSAGLWYVDPDGTTAPTAPPQPSPQPAADDVAAPGPVTEAAPPEAQPAAPAPAADGAATGGGGKDGHEIGRAHV